MLFVEGGAVDAPGGGGGAWHGWLVGASKWR